MEPKRQIPGIPDHALSVQFVKSRGPGGQHVNTSSTGVQLRVQLDRVDLPDPVLERLRRLAGHHLTGTNELVIASDRYRSQLRNREATLDRLEALIEKAREQPRRRVATAPPRAQKERRVTSKKQRGKTKKLRRRPNAPHD